MNLCFIANPNSVHTQRWVRYFSERGHAVHLIGEHALRRGIPPGVTFYDLPARFNVRKIRYLVWGLAVRRIVRQVQPDLLHTHQITSAGWLGAAAGYHPLLVQAWGSDLLVGPQRYWAHRQLARWVLRQADYVLCVSESLARAARALGADPARLEVTPMGVDTGVFCPANASSARRTELGLGPGPVVISIRAMRPLYNPLDIAQAIPRILEQVAAAQFLILTYSYDPDVLSEFQSIVQKGGASHAVHYVGAQPDDNAIAELYRLADIAVSVPSSDGTPLSVLEAMACGVPLVLSDVPSLHEWVQHEREALFVPTGDVEAISAAILRMLRNDLLRQSLARNGTRLVRQRAGRGLSMRRVEEIYHKLIERGTAKG